MESHKFHSAKIKIPLSECADAAELLVPAALSVWGFGFWLVRGFVYRLGTPGFEGEFPNGVNVKISNGHDDFWTDRLGLAAIAPLIHADWTDVVGCSEILHKQPLLPDLVGGDFVMLSCIDGVHWLCLSSDEANLERFREKIPYPSESIYIDLHSRGDWGV